MLSLNNLEFRKNYPLFTYHSFDVVKSGSRINIKFHFSIDGLCDFFPTVSVETDGLVLFNDFNSKTAEKIIFNMGMVEAVSYFKPVCPEKIIVKCGTLSAEDKRWWKHLWFNGLGEFFYINNINADEESFIQIDAPESTDKPDESIELSGINIIPVGGGKDSCVTAELMKEFEKKNLFFTINDQQARTDCVLKAGYSSGSIIKVYRTISPELLELNKKGFLNGHTPFSAVVAFTSFYTAYLLGAERIVLSNESSANEGNTESGVNHQYSKSFEFEQDFNDYAKRNLTSKIHYFSLLRPFNELQIAKMFSAFPQYRDVFRSCNRGSKKNIWCESCSKCLFVYGILSAFLSESELKEAFSSDMLNNADLLEDFKGLTGLTPTKPFECVGTSSEFNYAVAVKICKLKKENKELPLLLSVFDNSFDAEKTACDSELLNAFNSENLVPADFSFCISEMYNYVKNN